jgi:hypothetical protein
MCAGGGVFQACKQMIVIEERRSFLEKNIRDGLFHQFVRTKRAGEMSSRLYGKKFPGPHGLPGIPETRGLNPSVLAQIDHPLIKATEEIPAELRNGRLSAKWTRCARRASPSCSAHADLLPRLPASRFGQRPRRNQARKLPRRRLHAPHASPRAGRPRLPRRHRLLHHAHVRAEQGPHAQLQRHGPRRRDRPRHRPVHHQQAGRLHGRLDLLPQRPDRHLQLDQERPGHHLRHPRQQDDRDDRPAALTVAKLSPADRPISQACWKKRSSRTA